METLECIHKCKAIRFYAETPVPEDTLMAILEAGRRAGSGKNTQLWHFIVIRDAEQKAALAATGGYASHFKDAAFGIVIASEINPYVPAISYFDVGRAAQNMMLAATALGVGSCPAGFRDDPVRAAQLLGLPDNRELVIGIAFGYPDKSRVKDEAEFRSRVLDTQGRKALAELASVERFGNPFGV